MFFEPVPQSEEKVSLWRKILAVAIYLVFWIVLSGIGLWLAFELRSLIVDLMILGELNPWAVRGYDRLGIFVLGLIWFVSMLWLDHYLRKGMGKGRLWRNIGRVAAVQASLTAVIFATRFIINL